MIRKSHMKFLFSCMSTSQLLLFFSDGWSNFAVFECFAQINVLCWGSGEQSLRSLLQCRTNNLVCVIISLLFKQSVPHIYYIIPLELYYPSYTACVYDACLSRFHASHLTVHRPYAAVLVITNSDCSLRKYTIKKYEKRSGFTLYSTYIRPVYMCTFPFFSVKSLYTY